MVVCEYVGGSKSEHLERTSLHNDVSRILHNVKKSKSKLENVYYMYVY